MTEKVAVWPAVTVEFAGCWVMVGATAVAVTVRVAALLVTFPAELLTTTLNFEPLSAVVVAGVVYVAKFAPVIEVVPFCH